MMDRLQDLFVFNLYVPTKQRYSRFNCYVARKQTFWAALVRPDQTKPRPISGEFCKYVRSKNVYLP